MTTFAFLSVAPDDDLRISFCCVFAAAYVTQFEASCDVGVVLLRPMPSLFWLLRVSCPASPILEFFRPLPLWRHLQQSHVKIVFSLSLVATNWMRKSDLTYRIYAAPSFLPFLKCLGSLRLFLSILIQQSFNLNRSLAFKVMSTHKRRPDIPRKLTGQLLLAYFKVFTCQLFLE
jgi:hypothetical protein